MKNLLIIMGILMIGLISANSVVFNEKNISSDIILNKESIPFDYYSFITFDLNNFFEDDSIDIYSIKSNLSLAVVGGTLEPKMLIGLIQNQTINLTNDTIDSIFFQSIAPTRYYQWSDVGSSMRYEIPINDLIKTAIIDGNRFVTLRLQDNLSIVYPDNKQDSGTLIIGSNTNQLTFGSSTQNSVTDYKPKLRIFYDLINNSNIPVNPTDTRWLPQLNSTIQLDKEGIERTYLFCTWRIDGNGQETIMMNVTMCPEERQNFTFTSSEKYFVSIDYSTIFYNLTSLNWEISEVGNVANLTQFYNVNIPEPPGSLFTSIINIIRGWINSIICFLFGFCS